MEIPNRRWRESNGTEDMHRTTVRRAVVPVVSPNSPWHRGDIMFTVQTTAIFWGQNWSNVTFAGDKISGLDDFYNGIKYSPYARTSDEYTDANGSVSDTITYTGHVID